MFSSPPQLVISYKGTLPKQIIELNIFCKALKGTTKLFFKYEPQYLVINLSAFEKGISFSLALKKVDSYMRDFTEVCI